MEGGGNQRTLGFQRRQGGEIARVPHAAGREHGAAVGDSKNGFEPIDIGTRVGAYSGQVHGDDAGWATAPDR